MHDSNDFKPKILVIGVGEGGEQVCGSIFCRYASRIGTDHLAFVHLSAVDERQGRISSLCQGVDWVFVIAIQEEAGCLATAGTAATLAKSTGAFVTALVSKPPNNEGDCASAGLDELQAQTDSVFVISSQPWANWADPGSDDSAKLTNAFAHAFWSLVGIVMAPDRIYLTWDDIRAMICGKRLHVGFGIASGEHRAGWALSGALASPLLMRDQHPTPCLVLIHVSNASDVTVGEVGKISKLLGEQYPEASRQIGFSIDPGLRKALRVYVIFIE